MKFTKIIVSAITSMLITNSTFSQNPQFPNRGCGTPVPDQQWENHFQQLIQQYVQQHPELIDNITGKVNGNNQIQANYTIPVIIHVIHGGQAVGTYPNLANGQLVSQIQVLNEDFAGIGYNTSTYPSNAFVNYAASLPAANKDGNGRVKIANTGIQFCLATKDTLGNILPEPGIDRVNYNSLPALTGTFTSKNPAAAAYNTPSKFQGFIDGYIKKNTIWNVSKYLNIWVTDENASVGLLGYATFPYLSGLTGIPGSTGTSTTDGFWCWAKAFGSINIYPSGTYDPTYKYGRTCTHEIGHWLGLRHIWGDGTCATDYCNDTPPAQTANYGCPTYPFHSGTCAGNSPNGEMFMNFMDYTDDPCMYMFTVDQTTRIQTAMANSPYRKFLGTHGLCSTSAATLNVSFTAPSSACAGVAVTMTNNTTGSPTPTYTWVVTPTAGVTYNPNQNATNPSITFANGGTYTITLTASNGTVGTASQTISITQLSVTSNQTSVTCNGGSNGSATVTVSGGTPSYSYTWAPTGGNAATASGLTAGNYTVTIKDANNCSTTKTLSITQPPALSVTVNQTNVSCNGGNNGSATVSVSGGTPSYSYTWAPTGGYAATASGLTAGNYTVTIKDANNCSTTKTLSITQPPALSVTANQTNVSCNGGNNGSATVTVSGGTPAYSYTWAPTGGNAATASGLTAGNYTVTIKDANNCSTTKTLSITQPPALSVTANQTNVSCNGGNNGSATVSVSGGTPAYSYTWAPTGGNAATASGLTAGNYTVTIKDANNCSTTKTLSITQPPALSVTVNQTNVSCNGGNNGSATVSVSGGTPAYSYTWAPTGGNAATASGLTAGNYTVTIKDANNCSTTKTLSITQPSALSVTVNQNNVSCNGGNNGSATVTVSGGTPSYSYTWAPTGGNAAAASGLTAGNYTVTIKDANNCSTTKTLSITQPSALSVTVNQTNVSCNGGNNGSATVSVSGGTPAYSYTWAPTGGNAATASGLTAGNYTVTVKDANNCSITKTLNISQPAPINTSVTISGGTLTALQTGASYQWVDCNNAYAPIAGATNISYVAPSNGSYAVIITVGSCSDTSACQVITAISGISVSNQIQIYPNPANEFIYIDGVNPMSKIEMYDAIGKLIITEKVISNSIKLNTHNLDEGVYFIRITSNESVLNKKVIIKK
ncbi:MAG TPA: T9SS type A sorting domain-containing protein [Bacteroidia bacterium]|nr:T9SS type A sorting domain-containing protein [Bacteroidia bacterium]